MSVTKGTITSSHVQVASANLTFNATIDVGTAVVTVHATLEIASDPTSVTVGGVSATKSKAENDGVFNSSIWTLTSPSSGTQSIVITPPSNTKIGGGVICWTGTATSPVGATAGNHGVVTTGPTVSITSTVDNSYLVGGVYGGGAAFTVTAPSVQDYQVTDSDFGVLFGESQTTTTAGSYTLAATTGGVNNRYISAAIELKPSTAGVVNSGFFTLIS